jgi:hypothetical protein
MLMSFDPDNAYLYKNSEAKSYSQSAFTYNFNIHESDTTKALFFKINNSTENTADNITTKKQHYGNKNYFYPNR